MAHFHGSVSGKHVHGDGSWAAAPVIDAITPSSTSIAVAWTGSADEYRINNGTAAALPDGTSPDTITGLTANTEYNAPGLQLRYLGGAWSAAVAFGTVNPASGADEAVAPIALQVAEESETAFTLFLAQVLGVAVESDEAMQLLQPGALEAAQEADEAVPLVLISLGAITAAEEQDQAVALQLIEPITLGVAFEFDAALELDDPSPVFQTPTGYYRRNARDVLAGRRPGDGAELMLRIGARSRQRGGY